MFLFVLFSEGVVGGGGGGGGGVVFTVAFFLKS